jgi:hypothetical protein
MNHKYSLLYLVLVLLNSGIYAQNRTVQFVHNSVDSALDSVDIYLNNSLLFDNLPFRHSTPFLELPSWDGISTERIHVLPQGSSDSLVAVLGWSLPSQDGTYQVVMNGVYNSGEFPGTQFIHFDVSAETELNASSSNQFKLRFHHGVDDGPALDIGESSTAFPDIWANNIVYGGFSPYIERNDSIYRVGIFSEEILVLNYAGYFNNSNYLGKSSTLILSGLAGSELIETDLTVSLYQINSSGGPFLELPLATVLDTAIVQFIHASPSAELQEVDVYLNNELWLDNFQALEATPFLKIPANRDIQLAICSAQSLSSIDPLFTSFFNLPISVQTGVLIGQSNSVGEPIRPLQIVWRDNARKQALESDETDVLFFNAALDLNSCDIRAFEPVTASLCQDLNYGNYSSSGYISIPPYNYAINILDPLSVSTFASIELEATALEGDAIVLILTGFLNPSQNPDGFPLGMHFTNELGGMLVPCSITTGVDNNSSMQFSVLVYPNPAGYFVKIKREFSAPELLHIELRDAFGRLVYESSTSEMGHEVNTSALPSGLYFIRLYNSNRSEVRTVFVAH